MIKEITVENINILKKFGFGRIDYYWLYSKDGPFHKKEILTKELVAKHIKGEIILGCSPFINNTNVMFGVIDVDAHTTKEMNDDEKEKLFKETKEDSIKLYDYLIKKNYPVIMNSSGSNGKHIRIYVKNMNAKNVRNFLEEVQITVFKKIKHEIFPKQDYLDESRPYGNQIKLFLGIHPKTNQRSDIISDGKMLNIQESFDFMKNIIEHYNEYKTIKIIKKIEQNDEKKVVEIINNDIPEKCNFIEEVASKKLLPSGNITRHHYIDPNVSSYTIQKEKIRDEYKEVQGKQESALSNWKTYWKDKPQFNCGQIISYLLKYQQTNDTCKIGLNKCINCFYFKKYKREIINSLINNINLSDEEDKISQIRDILNMLTKFDDDLFIENCLNKIKDKTGFSKNILKKEFLKNTKENSPIIINVEDIDNLRNNVMTNLLLKKRSEATELLVKDIESKNFIFTTRDDIKSEIWIYKDGIYIPQGKSFIKEYLRQILKETYNNFIANEVISKIEADTQIEHDDFFSSNYIEEIPLNNGILNIFTKQITPYNPKKIFFNKIPIDYNPDSKCPNILNHFNKILRDPDDVKVILELFGYLLLKEYKIEKGFMFVGKGRNGKSKTLELMKHFLGVDNCSAINLNSLNSESFSIHELFGKMANLAGDLSKTDLKDTGMIKNLLGRDIISAKRKFLRELKFVNYAKMIFAANELPRVYDTTDGFWTKWILLEFPYKFINEKEYNSLEESEKINHRLLDTDIIQKLTSSEELSGLLNVALKSLQKILEEGDFSYSKGTNDVKDLWIRQSDSFTSFCMDCLEQKFENKITKQELRQEYFKYRMKHKVTGCSDLAIKITLENMFGVHESKPHGEERKWVGISFKK